MKTILARHARLLLAAGAFSLFVNLLVLAAPLYMLQVYDRVLSSRSLETLVVLAVIALIALAALAWLDSIRMQLLARAAVRIEAAASVPILRRMVEAAGLAARAYRHGLRDLRAIRNFLSSAGTVAFMDAPWSPVFVALITLFHPLLGALAVGGVALLLVLAWLDDRLSRQAVETAAESSRKAAELAEETLANAEVVRALGMLGDVEQRSRSAADLSAREFLAAGRASSRVLALSKFSRQALQVAMLGVGAYLVIRREVSPGAMIAATLLLSRAMAPIETAISGWRQMIEARAAYRRVAALLAAPPSAAPMPLPAPRGEVAVERVTLMADAKSALVKGVSFALAGGELLGLIGPSGAGKSMLGRVLVGVLPPTAGAVRIDGAELPQWDADALGRHIGYLPQDVQLFDGTVAENIARLRNPRGEHAQIVHAAQLAGAHELILQLPKGYDTPIGARGHLLSSGQRQLIGLARALFGQPTLIVLDEPNANLDADGEENLLAALRCLKERRATVVLITHRPALLRDADKVLVLRAGAVAGFGDREEILGKFARLAVAHAPAQRSAAAA